jgi:uncharacterized membrane protein YgaE (UPF0421/DUF939 family)
MTVTNYKAPDNFRPDDGLTGWKRVVAAIVIAAAAIATLWLTGSMYYATGVAALIFVALGVKPRR